MSKTKFQKGLWEMPNAAKDPVSYRLASIAYPAGKDNRWQQYAEITLDKQTTNILQTKMVLRNLKTPDGETTVSRELTKYPDIRLSFDRPYAGHSLKAVYILNPYNFFSIYIKLIISLDIAKPPSKKAEKLSDAEIEKLRIPPKEFKAKSASEDNWIGNAAIM
ncbi:10219_t:CDS:2 [Gigaspora rosea]|nr:10219_t:CDS:2 [Gigaspora rosea]